MVRRTDPPSGPDRNSLAISVLVSLTTVHNRVRGDVFAAIHMFVKALRFLMLNWVLAATSSHISRIFYFSSPLLVIDEKYIIDSLSAAFR